MIKNKINRRIFIRNTALAATAMTLAGKTVFAVRQKLRRIYYPDGKALTCLIIFRHPNLRTRKLTGQPKMI